MQVGALDGGRVTRDCGGAPHVGLTFLGLPTPDSLLPLGFPLLFYLLHDTGLHLRRRLSELVVVRRVLGRASHQG